MECFGRLMAGLAPWISLPDDDTSEGIWRKQLREWALKSYAQAVDPESPDYLLWRKEGQTLVDAAYIAESFIRGYDALWLPLDSVTKQRYITEFTQLRRVDPPYTNWLLFSATVEAFLRKAGAPSDTYRIASALRKVEEWYVGDGWYSDGKDFAFDYYNSFVLHPMYIEPLEIMTNSGKNKVWNMPECDYNRAVKRMQRFGMILERFISPEGTLPVFGRSITYRTGTLQPLALLAWREWLPKELPDGQVRAAMTAVIKRMFGDDRNFNEKDSLLWVSMASNRIYPIGIQIMVAYIWHHLLSCRLDFRLTIPSGHLLPKTGQVKKPGKGMTSRKTMLFINNELTNKY